MATIIIRPVGNTCNLACSYCYVNPQISKKMSLTIFKKGLERITAFYLGEKIKTIEILFHGGEPLLWGLEYYKKAEKIISAFEKKYSLKYSRCVQTNLCSYNLKLAEFFKKNNYFVSTSIDGNKTQNGCRVDCAGKNSFDLIISNLKLLKEYQKNVGVVVSVGKHNADAKQLFDFLNSNGINANINFIFSSDFALNLTEKKAFFRKLVDIYFKKDPIKVKIKNIDQYLKKAIYGKEINSCEFSRKTLNKKRQFALNPDGKVYYCNRFAGLQDKEKYFLFDIADKIEIKKQMDNNKKFKEIIAYERNNNSAKLLSEFKGARGCFYKNVILKSLVEDANLKKDNYEYICKKLKVAGVI